MAMSAFAIMPSPRRAEHEPSVRRATPLADEAEMVVGEDMRRRIVTAERARALRAWWWWGWGGGRMWGVTWRCVGECARINSAHAEWSGLCRLNSGRGVMWRWLRFATSVPNVHWRCQ